MFDATPLMRGHAALRYFELGAAEPPGVQRYVLEKIIERAASTKFGKDHRLAGLDTVHAFQENVPLRRYEDFFHEYWQPVFPRTRGLHLARAHPLFRALLRNNHG